MISIRNIDHVVIRTADMNRALAFYGDVLGCREARRLDSIGLVQLRAGPPMIDLMDASANPPPDGAGNMDHFAVRVEPFDADAIRALRHDQLPERLRFERRHRQVRARKQRAHPRGLPRLLRASLLPDRAGAGGSSGGSGSGSGGGGGGRRGAAPA